MKITNIRIQPMKGIDLSDDIRYRATVNDNIEVLYKSDGVFKPHLTADEFIEHIKNNLKQ